MKRGLWYIAVLVILFLVISNAQKTQSTGVSARAANSLDASSPTHTVLYKITTSRDWGGCYGFDTTYEMPSGTSQKSVSACDGATSAVVDQRPGNSGDFVYLSVQNDEQSARIGCEIYIDGKLTYRNYSQGQFVITDCSGSIE